MNYNPYAAPQAAPPPPGAPLAYGGAGPQPWDIGEVLTASFEALKVNWVVLVFTYFVTLIITMVAEYAPRIPTFVGVFRIGSGPDLALTFAGMVVGGVISSFFYVGLVRIWLGVARGQTVDFSQLFGGADRFLPLLGAGFLALIAVSFGFVLLFVPGVLLSLGLCFTGFFVVDQGMSPVDALQASWRATEGHKGKLFLLGLVAFCIVFGAELCCFLPVFAALPMVMVALTIVYLRVTGRGAAAVAPAAPPGGGFGGPGGAPPGGGYGGPPPGGGGYGPPGGGGGYGPPGGGGGYGPPGGGGGYGPPGGGGFGNGGPFGGGGGPGGPGGPPRY